MNKIILFIFVPFLMLMSSAAYSQQQEKFAKPFDRRDFIAKHDAFISKEVGLTQNEAAVFLPLSNEMHDKMFQVGTRCRRLTRDVRNSKTQVSSKVYKDVLYECLKVHSEEAKVEQQYYRRFEKVLSPEKLFKYRQAERKFGRQFMRAPADRPQR